MSFRDNLQHLRATRGMTQEQLAEQLGVSRQSVTKWESESSYPEMDKLIGICELFGCSLDDLVKGDLTPAESHAAEPQADMGDEARAREPRPADPGVATTVADESPVVAPSGEGDGGRRPTRAVADFLSRQENAICSVIMLVATLVGLCWLFTGLDRNPNFWLPWPIGGILCAIVAVLAKATRSSR